MKIIPGSVLFVLVLYIPCIVHGQPKFYSADSIPMVDEEVVFKKVFQYNLSKEEYNARINLFLSKNLNPISGTIIENNADNTTCQVVDYISAGDNLFHSYGIYMIYRLNFNFYMGHCQLILNKIKYLEKGYIDAILDQSDKRVLPKFSAREIMIDQKLKQLFVRNASQRITKQSLQRINGIINDLNELFGIKED